VVKTPTIASPSITTVDALRALATLAR
jgi:hypothetical protein